MELIKYIGYRLEDVKTILDENNIHYKVIETFDTKKTKMGNEIRIVNIKQNQNSFSTEDHLRQTCTEREAEIEIYVAYF
jgi:hypothetical protein